MTFASDTYNHTEEQGIKGRLTNVKTLRSDYGKKNLGRLYVKSHRHILGFKLHGYGLHFPESMVA